MAKILLAEDDQSISEMYKIKLTQHGHQIVLASDGDEAIELLKKENDWDLVLLDIMMPNKNGYDVLDFIRNESPQPEIKVIALTNFDERIGKASCENFGVKEYIIKANFTPEEIAKKVNETIIQKL